MDVDTSKKEGFPVKIESRNGKDWVDARTLYQALGVGRPFSSWIKGCITKLNLVQNVDYEFFFRSMHDRKGQVREYSLSLEIAEKLSMLEQRPTYRQTLFDFGDRKLCAISYNGELWFILQEICDMIGIDCSRHTADYLDENIRTTIQTRIQHKTCFKIVNECGLYTVVFRSRKPKAKEVGRWLVNIALPQIRKAYASPPSFMDKFRQFFKSFRKEPKTVPPYERPGFPLALPEKGDKNV